MIFSLSLLQFTPEIGVCEHETASIKPKWDVILVKFES